MVVLPWGNHLLWIFAVAVSSHQPHQTQVHGTESSAHLYDHHFGCGVSSNPVEANLNIKSSPVIDFFIEAGVAFTILPVERILRYLIFRGQTAETQP